MKSKLLLLPVFCIILLTSCKVTFITGYDQVLDQTLGKMKRDFNLHFIKLGRTIQDTDPHNQDFVNFQDYYDNLEADMITIKSRSQSLDEKARIVKEQISNLDAAFKVFINQHKAGLPDRQSDDRHDMRDAINTSIDAITKLQEALKTTGKTAY